MAARRRNKSQEEKRIPRNPRYEHVQSSLDTGPASMTNYMKRAEHKKKYAPKPGELFKRIQPSNFIRLAMEDRMAGVEMEEAQPYHNADVDLDDEMGGAGEVYEDTPSDVSSITGGPRRRPPPVSARGTRGGNLNGILTGDYTLPSDEQPPQGGADTSLVSSFSSRGSTPVSSYLDDSIVARTYEKRYLLLDVRTVEEFDECHIDGAISYPAAMLSRATNYFTTDIYKYKNKTERLIIVYDDGEERVAPAVASIFFQKGVDNIVLLSGGLKEVAMDAPDFVVGELPEELYPEPEPSVRGSARGSTRGGRRTGGESVATTSRGNTTSRSIASARSVRSSRSTRTQQSDGSVQHERGWRP